MTMNHDRMVYQPNQANWPDGLASFEAFTSIDEGRRHYPEIPASQWISMPESHIEDAVIVEVQEPLKMTKELFDTEQQANDYKRVNRLHQRVAEQVSGTGKWALNFPIEAHVTVNDGVPEEFRERQGA